MNDFAKSPLLFVLKLLSSVFLLKEGVREKNPEKVWSFANPPPHPPPRFGLFMTEKFNHNLFWKKNDHTFSGFFLGPLPDVN